MWEKVNEDYPNYSVNELGEVRNDLSGKILSQHLTRNGFKLVSLSAKGKQKTFYVHRLVGVAFIPQINTGVCVEHLDGIRSNNHVNNLMWAHRHECRIKMYP